MSNSQLPNDQLPNPNGDGKSQAIAKIVYVFKTSTGYRHERFVRGIATVRDWE